MTPGDELRAVVAAVSFLEELFDPLADVVFFIKDAASRYVMVNRTLVERCGVATKAELIGRTTLEVFPHPLGERYLKQDRQVIAGRVPLSARLELHLFPNRSEGWCLTDKVPILGRDQSVIGLAGLSRDLRSSAGHDDDLREVAATIQHIQAHYDDDLRVESLAAAAGLSSYQLGRRIREVFAITPGQLITKTRIDAACRLLRTSSAPVAEVAQRCGYCDQSAFTRQFKATVGLTPGQYRERHG